MLGQVVYPYVKEPPVAELFKVLFSVSFLSIAFTSTALLALL